MRLGIGESKSFVTRGFLRTKPNTAVATKNESLVVLCGMMKAPITNLQAPQKLQPASTKTPGGAPLQGEFKNGSRRRQEADDGGKNTSASLPRRLQLWGRFLNSRCARLCLGIRVRDFFGARSLAFANASCLCRAPFLAAAWLTIAMSGSGLLAATTLVEKGRSHYRIVIPANAIPAERYAAEELQRYLEGMSGGKLPIGTDTGPIESREILLGENA